MNVDLEIEFFQRFIASSRRDRFKWHVSNPKRRDKIFADLRDTRHFNQSKLSQVDCSDDVVEFLKANQVSKEIYVISTDENLDGKLVSIQRLGEFEFWMPGEVIGYCKNAKVGFFKNHEEWFYLLQ